ncbi:MAG: DUF6677 family protein [Planctomycetota bacterium]
MAKIILPLVAVLLLVRFVTTSSARQRNAVLLAWLVPGLGHFHLGEKKRGLWVGGLILLTFVAGMAIADFRNISPFDRHSIWGLAHLFGGLMAGIAALATGSLNIYRDNAAYHVGCLYSGVAALLNILAMIDAWDLATAKDRKETLEVAKTDDAPPAPTREGVGS